MRPTFYWLHSRFVLFAFFQLARSCWVAIAFFLCILVWLFSSFLRIFCGYCFVCIVNKFVYMSPETFSIHVESSTTSKKVSIFFNLEYTVRMSFVRIENLVSICCTTVATIWPKKETINWNVCMHNAHCKLVINNWTGHLVEGEVAKRKQRLHTKWTLNHSRNGRILNWVT